VTDQNPYDVLGVDKTASRDDVRKAYKRKARKFHPDRPGGDQDKMRALNVAYAVLENPERRRRFDTDGRVDPPQSIDELARSKILAVLMPALEGDESNNPLDVTLCDLRNDINGMHAARRKFKNTIARLERRLKRLKGPPGNFIAFAIGAQINAAREVLSKIDRDEEIWKRAIEILKDYEYEQKVDSTTGLGLSGFLTGRGM
jgi:curved DNA-binding protein CbpA